MDVLRFALDSAGVELRTGVVAREILRADGGYEIKYDGGSLHADWLIVACGGAAGSKLGGVRDGYELLKPLGHKATALRPSLVQLLTAPEYPRALKGVRADCRISLQRGEETLCEGRGELQFTETGVSGPAAFDISRRTASEDGKLTLSIDFLRDYPRERVLELLRARRAALPDLPAEELLTGMLHNRLGRMMIKYAGIGAQAPLRLLEDEELERVADACRNFRLALLGTEGFDCAQVTAGGIKTGGFDPETLESWFMPRLFVCGELLDVDGDCGGYNLQWAWASGRLAGRLGK